VVPHPWLYTSESQNQPGVQRKKLIRPSWSCALPPGFSSTVHQNQKRCPKQKFALTLISHVPSPLGLQLLCINAWNQPGVQKINLPTPLFVMFLHPWIFKYWVSKLTRCPQKKFDNWKVQLDSELLLLLVHLLQGLDGLRGQVVDQQVRVHRRWRFYFCWDALTSGKSQEHQKSENLNKFKWN